MNQPQQAVVSTGVIPGQPMQTQHPPYRTHFRNPNFASQQALFIGISQIVIGVLCIVFNIAALGINEIISVAAHGIWCGILFIITGSLGVGAARTNSKCLIISFNVMGIILACLCLFLLGLGIAGAAISSSYLPYIRDRYTTTTTRTYSNGNYYYSNNYNYYNYYYYYYGCTAYTADANELTSCIQGQVAMESLLAILAFIGGILTLWGCALACRAHCCCRCCRVGATYRTTGVNTGVQQQQYYPTEYPLQNYPPQNYPLPPQNYAPPQNYNPQGYPAQYPGYAGPQGQQAGLPVQQPQGYLAAAPPYTASASPNTNIEDQPDKNKGFPNHAYESLRK